MLKGEEIQMKNYLSKDVDTLEYIVPATQRLMFLLGLRMTDFMIVKIVNGPDAIFFSQQNYCTFAILNKLLRIFENVCREHYSADVESLVRDATFFCLDRMPNYYTNSTLRQEVEYIINVSPNEQNGLQKWLIILEIWKQNQVFPYWREVGVCVLIRFLAQCVYFMPYSKYNFDLILRTVLYAEPGCIVNDFWGLKNELDKFHMGDHNEGLLIANNC